MLAYGTQVALKADPRQRGAVGKPWAEAEQAGHMQPGQVIVMWSEGQNAGGYSFHYPNELSVIQ